MRRASLFAPLLLIGLGALFLARNVYPDLRLLDYLAKYWPFLLILWGVLRLGEILYWGATRQPFPRTGISGGEWGLVVLLCFIGVTLHTVMGFSTWFPNRFRLGGLDMFGESFDYPIAGNKPTSKTPHVLIESFSGNARIIGMDSQEVKVTGRKTIRSLDQNGADRANEEAAFEITGSPDQVVIRTNQNRAGGPRSVSEEIEILVPKGASIEAHGEARGRSGDFDIHDVDGTVTITSDNSGVRLENIGGETRLDLRTSDIVRAVNLKGSLDLKGRGGDIDLENISGPVSINGFYSGMLQFHNLSKTVHFVGPQTEFFAERIPGQVRMPLNDFTGTNLVGPIRLTTRSRDVQISDFTNSLEISADRADIELRPGTLPLSKIDVHTRIAGDITLALPAASKFNLTASTGAGEVEDSFGGPVKVDQSGRGGTMRGSNGGPELNLRTERGRMTVRTASPDEPPLEPHDGEGRRFKIPGIPPVPPVPPVPGLPKTIDQ
jgi:DUF4097 and DUF4098 domain-containing protein YvlB